MNKNTYHHDMLTIRNRGLVLERLHLLLRRTRAWDARVGCVVHGARMCQGPNGYARCNAMQRDGGGLKQNER